MEPSVLTGTPPDSRFAARVLRALHIVWHVTKAAGILGPVVCWLWLRRRTDRIPERCGQALAQLCERLGPTYIKLAQVLSSRRDLLPDAFLRPLAHLQDQVEPVPFEAIQYQLVTALGDRASRILPGLAPHPVAAASIAQVHHCRLADGRAVAVKVRRPGVAEQIRLDFALLRLAAKGAGRIPGLRGLPLTGLVDELAPCVEQQVDLCAEAHNLIRFRTAFSRVSDVVFPEPILDLTEESVLTMEFFDGLLKVDTPHVATSWKQVAAVSGVRALFKMIFVDGLVHADLHPGNFFLRDDAPVVILDAGLVAELDDDDRRRFTNFFYGIVTNDGPLCAEILEATATSRSPRFRHAAFLSDVTEVIGRHARLPAADFEVASFVAELFGVQYRHGLQGSTRFTMAILSLLVLEGIVKQLHPQLDFQSEARPYLIVARHAREVVSTAVGMARSAAR